MPHFKFDDAIYISVSGFGASSEMLDAAVQEVKNFLDENGAINVETSDRNDNRKSGLDFRGNAFIQYYNPDKWIDELGYGPEEDMKLARLQKAFKASSSLVFRAASVELDSYNNIVINVPDMA